ncbi:LytTR family DNA-binding domain-containing protein [Bordetella sp. BOR01]|uniref:LytR/AlgR family response regulator transcription factor n=1 Tax=Bordetella sp. BOR01 TaxID=2854779 RepID=UPI001C45ED5E|nr:LytTR family DNA-binding domain-containing protein [Bordetella sp. BOR01]MBV7484292.1 LytTR family DNA-binding domain-containing protein [Bordetella sp. BOR01]
MMRIVIVDDEAPARRYLRRLIESLDGPQVVAEAACMQSAIDLINLHRPDAIFLDIELTLGTSFDVLSALQYQPCIVFVTAHAPYATRAFDVDAVDYLLKPVGIERLRQAVQRLYARLNRPWGDAPFLTVRNHGQSQLIRAHALAALVAQRDYVKLHAEHAETHLVYATLKGLLPQLGTLPFAQVSRSIVVNLDQVGKVVADGGLSARVEFLNDALPLQLGRTAFLRLRGALDERRRGDPG